MADSLLNLREIGLEALRAEVERSLALTMRLRVDEKPPLASFERQTLSCAEIQDDPLRVTSLWFGDIVAKIGGGVTIVPLSQGNAGAACSPFGTILKSKLLFDFAPRNPIGNQRVAQFVADRLGFGG